MPTEERFAADPRVIFRRVAEETVLVHLETQQVYELNETGSRVWELLCEGLTRAEVAERLAAEYEVGQRELDADLDALLAELRGAGLLHPLTPG